MPGVRFTGTFRPVCTIQWGLTYLDGPNINQRGEWVGGGQAYGTLREVGSHVG